jgi:hypothetical protein
MTSIVISISYRDYLQKKHLVTILLQSFDLLVTTRSARCGTFVFIENNAVINNSTQGVLTMNTEYVTEQTFGTPEQSSKTLKTLFDVICADNEFSLLRETLRLYCEEIARVD